MSVLILRFCALKLVFKLISIADCAPSFELVRRRKYSHSAIFTARRKYRLGLAGNSQEIENKYLVTYRDTVNSNDRDTATR